MKLRLTAKVGFSGIYGGLLNAAPRLPFVAMSGDDGVTPVTRTGLIRVTGKLRSWLVRLSCGRDTIMADLGIAGTYGEWSPRPACRSGRLRPTG